MGVGISEEVRLWRVACMEFKLKSEMGQQSKADWPCGRASS